jgi:hypothetical protein
MLVFIYLFLFCTDCDMKAESRGLEQEEVIAMQWQRVNMHPYKNTSTRCFLMWSVSYQILSMWIVKEKWASERKHPSQFPRLPAVAAISCLSLLSRRRMSCLFTHSLTKLSTWVVANCVATQELPGILWNPKVHCRVQKSPPLVPILSPINPIHTISPYLRSILILSTHLRLGLPSGLFRSVTSILYAFLFPPFVLHAHPISTTLAWSF